VAVWGCGGGEGGEPLGSYRGSARSDSVRRAQSILTTRPVSLTDHVVQAAKFVRATLGDSALPDPAGLPKQIDTLVLKLSSRLFMVSDPGKVIVEMNRELFQVRGIEFDRARRDLAGVFPHTVLAQHRGSCLGISLLYLMVGERLDVPLYGVLVPEHFFVRFQGADTSFNIETIKQGQCMDDEWYRTKYRIRKGTWYDDLRGLGRDEVVGVLYFNVGNACREAGRMAEAVQCYERCLKALPRFAEAWGNLGVACEAMGEHGKALNALEKARAIDPNLKNLAGNIGAVRLRLEQNRDAVADFRRAVARDPASPDALYGLALALYRSGARADAESCAAAALQLRPEMREAQSLLERVRDRGAGPSPQ